MPGQKIDGKFQSFRTNINANMQLKNLWFIGMFVGYVPHGNDFYEPRNTGYSFRTPRRIQFNPWFETNATKKYYLREDYFVGIRSLFNSPNHQLILSQRYRFSDKFSLGHDLLYNPAINDAGYYGMEQSDILFSRRDVKTIENIFSVKYSFSNKSGLTFRARHYWSKVYVKELYDLHDDGSISPTIHSNIQPVHQNFNIFNIDAVYTWQFAPGSFINIVWKEEGLLSDGDVDRGYFTSFDRTLGNPQNNNLSVKIIYYLDYLDFKKWGKKNAK